MTVEEPDKSEEEHRKGDDASNIPLPFYVNRANSIKKVSTPEELTRWEKEVSELVGFQKKSDESSTISYAEPGHQPSDMDVEPLVFGTRSSRYEPMTIFNLNKS
jgi:hypothetical protein